MNRRETILLGLLATLTFAGPGHAGPWGTTLPPEIGEPLALPAPDTAGGGTLHAVMASRRSVREFSDEAVTLKELSQLLWAAQGVTSDTGYRTVPSAGAKFPIEVYVVVDRVEGLEPGLYHYRVGEHALALVRPGMLAADFQEVTFGQRSVGAAALSVVIVGVVWRVEEKYGPERSERYVVVEGGAVMEHVHLEATGLGLGAVCIGGFGDREFALFLGTDTLPIAIVPVGRPAP